VKLRALALLLALAAVLGVALGFRAPLLALAVGVERVDARALATTNRGPPPPLLVDVRDADAFADGHAPFSVRVAPASLDGFAESVRDRPSIEVLTIGDDGATATLAAGVLRAHGFARVRVVAGGISAWRAAGLMVVRGEEAATPTRFTADALPDLPLDRGEQLVATSAAVVLKPAYMLLTLALILWLRRGRPPEPLRGPMRLVLLGLVSFEIGETACAVDFFAHGQGLFYPIDFVHGLGMAGMVALLPWGVFQLVDAKVVRLVDPAAHCAVQKLCGHCWKREPVSCGLHRLFVFLIPALALVALMPLSAPLAPARFSSRVFLGVGESGMPVVNQIVELRVYPLLGAAFMLVALALSGGGPTKVARAEPPFFVGLGFLGFALFRFVVGHGYRWRLPWVDFWEEATELLAIVGVAVGLWLFRTQLGLVASTDDGAKRSLPLVPLERETP
jgi:rhodanese-related sulfurtransferase